MEFYGFDPSYILIFFLVVYAISALIINSSNVQYDKTIQRKLRLMGFKLQSKVSKNSFTFLSTIAAAVFKEHGLTPAKMKSKSYCTISWLSFKKQKEFSYIIFNLASGKERSFDSCVILSFYDFKQDNSSVMALLEQVEFSEFMELYDDGKYISLVIEHNSIAEQSLINILAVLGITNTEYPSKAIPTATELEHSRNSLKHLFSSVWVQGALLFAICFWWANLTLYSIRTLSLRLPDEDFIPIYWESSPLGFSFFFSVQVIGLLFFSKALVELFNKTDDDSTASLGFSLVTALSFLYLSHFAGFEAENSFVMETQRVWEAAEKEVDSKVVNLDMNISSNTIPLISPEIIKLARLGEFRKLEVLLDGYHDLVEQDISREMILYEAYLSFSIADKPLFHQLKTWVKQHPQSEKAIIANAFYYYGEAWRVRGTKGASNTSEEDLASMHIMLLKSQKLLESVAKVDRFDLVVKTLLIDISRTRGGYQIAKDIFQDTLPRYEGSYLLRHKFLIAAQPRWGGNYRTLNKVVDDAQAHSDKNSRLMLLKGYLFEEAGNIAAIDGDHQQASIFFSKGLKFGQNDRLLWKKGKSEFRQNHYTLALDFFNKAIAINSNDHEYYYWRSKTLKLLNKHIDATDDLLIAKQLAPNNAKYEKQIATLTQIEENTNYRGHFGFTLAGEVKSNSAIGNVRALKLYNEALASIKKNDPDWAAIKLMEAIEIDPHQIEFYLALDMILGQTKQWQPIINYWNKFIALYPENSRAHFEISGTYHHYKEPEKSLFHLKKAAELGNKSAKRAYKRLNSH